MPDLPCPARACARCHPSAGKPATQIQNFLLQPADQPKPGGPGSRPTGFTRYSKHIGSNLAVLRKESGGLDPRASSPGQLKAALLPAQALEVPPVYAWQVPYLSRLLTARLRCYYSIYYYYYYVVFICI